MRIGLLECDHVSDKFRSIAGDYYDMFAGLFSAASPEIDLVAYDAIAGKLPATPDECDGYVATGSRHSVYDDLGWIEPLCHFVRTVHAARVPFAGICFGHQLAAHALGGRVERAASGWGAGVRCVEIERRLSWMAPALDACALHFMHQDQVVALPADAIVLGRADHCPVAMFAIGERTIGIQAHPEFTPAYTDALLADRVARIGAAEVAAARAGLEQPTDEATIARWLAQFLAGSGESAAVGATRAG
jgi:GMP synthase-like glutamine amidotransferase